MSTAALQRKENDKAARAAAVITPPAQTDVSLESGAAVGVPLFLYSARATGVTSGSQPSPPSQRGNEFPIIQRQAEDGAQEQEELLQTPFNVQTKLTIGAADDPLEREADAVTERIFPGQGTEGPTVRTMPPWPPSLPISPSTSGLSNSAREGSAPLPASTRRFFESRFLKNLSDVRIHTDSEAGASASSLNAAAYTVGNHIVFGPGRYQPGTQEGRRLLAHELTHVQQQTASGFKEIQRDELSDSDVSEEAESVLSGGMSTEMMACTEESWAVGPATFDEDLLRQVEESGALEQSEPFFTETLTKPALIEHYKEHARELMLFRIDAMSNWIDMVVRAQITTPSGTGSEEAAESLRTAALEANCLAEEVWRRKTLFNFIEELINLHVPPEGCPIPWLARQTTIGSERYIQETFSQETLSRMGFPAEMPNILGLLDRLGNAPAITDTEITEYIIEGASEEDLWEFGFEHLRQEGLVIWWGNHVDPPIEWTEREYTDEEIRQTGLAHIHTDPRRREEARTLLELDHIQLVDPEERALLDLESTAPAYNYAALRYVVEGIRREEAIRLELAQNQLNNFLDQNPLLRMYISNWAVFENLLSSGVVFGFEYAEIIDPTNIEAETLVETLDNLLDQMCELREKVESDDDFLFDTAVLEFVTPLMRLYESQEPIYGEWIRDEFEENRKWEEFVNTLLIVGGLVGLALGGPLFASIGLASFGALAVRSHLRASDLEVAAHAGIGSLDEAAVGEFSAWLDTTIAAMSAVSVLARPVSAAVGSMVRAVRIGRMASPSIRVAVLLSRNLSAAEAAQVSAWSSQLERITQEAVRLVDSGGGTSRWAVIYRGSGPLGGTALARGNAIHYEAYQMIQNTFGNTVLVNRGASATRMGFLNSFGRERPDVRFAFSGGREVVFDITTLAQMGHSARYGSRAWVESLIEILYM